MGKNILIEREDGEIIMADYLHAEKSRKEKNSPLVIMVHGFPKLQKENDIFRILVKTVHDLGLSCLQFDLTKSVNVKAEEDKFTLKSAKQDIETILAWAENNNYTKVAFIAEGLGAPITFMSLPENAVFTILFWPAFDLKYVRDEQFNIKAHKKALEENGFFNLNGALIGNDLLDELQDTDITPYLKEAHTPTLALHGMKDEVIPIAHLDIARKDLIVPRLMITSFDDGKHGLTQPNHRKTIVQQIIEFIDKYKDFAPESEDEISV